MCVSASFIRMVLIVNDTVVCVFLLSYLIRVRFNILLIIYLNYVLGFMSAVYHSQLVIVIMEGLLYWAGEHAVLPSFVS